MRIRDADDLVLLERPPWSRTVRNVVLELDAAADRKAQLERSAAAINRELRACGCVTSAIFTVAALASLPVARALLVESLPGGWWRLSALAFAYVLGAALAGKITGLIISEVKLARSLRELRSLLQRSADDGRGRSWLERLQLLES